MSSPVGNTVGKGQSGTGTNPDFRLGFERQLMMDGYHGTQYQTNLDGYLFSATTANTGVIATTALPTTSALQVWNGPNTGVRLVIREVTVAYRSGTSMSGVIGYGINASQQTAPTTGTAITPVSLNGSNKSGQALANTGSTMSAAPTLVKLGPSLAAGIATAATTATVQPIQLTTDRIEGGIIVPQGACFAVDAYFVAGGTATLYVWSCVWEEIPIVN